MRRSQTGATADRRYSGVGAMELLMKLLSRGDRYWLTRLVLQRGLGLVYLLAFVAVIHQFKPLLGQHGLLPVPRFVAQVSFAESPSINEELRRAMEAITGAP